MKVIVIGAGISGLSAASTLLDNGINDFLLLEGRDRIGGRVHYAPEFAVPIDLGASWIHGVQKGNPLLAVAESMGLRLDITHNAQLTGSGGFKVFGPDGLKIDTSMEAVTRTKFDEINLKAREILKSMDEGVEDVSVEKLFSMALEKMPVVIQQEEQHFFNWLKSGIEGWENSTLDTISAKDHINEEDFTAFGGGDAFVIDGYFRIVQQKFQPKLQPFIRTGHDVKAIHHTKDGVRVITNRGEFQADYCIVTVPLGVLKNGDIEFVPALPKSKQVAIEKVGFGLMNKIVLQFDKVFWDIDAEGFGFVSETHGEFSFFLNLAALTKKPILMCFVAAEFAHVIEDWTDKMVIDRIMDILQSIFGRDQKISEPQVTRVTKWKADKFSRGSYSFIKAGCTPNDVKNLGKAVGRVRFSGEACFKRVGYVHGAYITGQKEAQRIADELKGTSSVSRRPPLQSAL